MMYNIAIIYQAVLAMSELGEYTGVESGRTTYNTLRVILPLYSKVINSRVPRTDVYNAIEAAGRNTGLERYVQQSMQILTDMWDANNEGKSVPYMQTQFLPTITAIAEGLRNQPNMLHIINTLEASQSPDVTTTITSATSVYGGNGALSVLENIASLAELRRTIRGAMLVNVITSLTESGMIRVADRRYDYLKGAIFKGLFDGTPKNAAATFAFLQNMVFALGDLKMGNGFVPSSTKIDKLFKRF